MTLEKSPDLSNLIPTADLQDFHENYFGKSPFFVKHNSSNNYSQLITMEGVNEFLTRKDNIYPFVKMVKDGMDLPPSLYTNGIKIGNEKFHRINPASLIDLFFKGASAVVQDIQLSFPVLEAFQNNLAKQFAAKGGCNAYITPANNKAFRRHYDAHHVFILQVYGSKLWKLYDMPVSNPLENSNASGSGEPQMEAELQQGDMLYLPPGLVHEVFARDTTSCHITLRLVPVNWLKVFRKILDKAGTIDAFREPFRYDKLSEDELLEKVRLLSGQLADHLSCKEIISEFKDPDTIERSANLQSKIA